MSKASNEIEKLKAIVIVDEGVLFDEVMFLLKKYDIKAILIDDFKLIQHKIFTEKPDIIILGLTYNQKEDGQDLCFDIKNNEKINFIPLVFVGQSVDELVQINAYHSGCDEFINFPIKGRLFKAKLNAIIYRKFLNIEYAQDSTILKFGNIEIDEEQVMVYKNGTEIKVSKKEFQLLLLLTSKPGKVFRRTNILTKVWGDDIIVGDRNIDTHIKKLRKIIGKEHIQTVRGIGFKFSY